MKSRKRVLALILVLITLPVVLAAVEAAAFYVENRNTGSIVSSGEKRDYVLYVPTSYDRNKPTPLVISMHGAGLWGAVQREISQWNEVAESAGVIVVYPSAVDSAGPNIWRAMPAQVQPDVAFISALIDSLQASYNIDPARIYADGLSNGGGMAFVLSCTLSDRIAAVGLVASAQTLPWNWCTDRKPMPMIAFHGTADSFIPYNGGSAWISSRPFPNMQVWAMNWARRNQCARSPIDSDVATDISRRAYTNCANGADVVLYTVQGGGHTWPGGGKLPEWLTGKTNHNIDATAVMWDFFREHRLVRN